MRAEDVWRLRSDEQVIAACRQIEDYEEEGRRILLEEVARRQLSVDAAVEPLPPRDARSDVADGGGLVRLWRGGYSLAVTWWGFALGGSWAWRILIMELETVLPATGGAAVIHLALYLAYYAYVVVALAGVWRSASRYRGRALWATLAKVGVAANAARAVMEAIYLVATA